jgi:hypothetical protein
MRQLKDLNENDFIKVKNIEEFKLLKANARHKNLTLYRTIKNIVSSEYPLYVSLYTIAHQSKFDQFEIRKIKLHYVNELLGIEKIGVFGVDPFEDTKKPNTEVDNSHYDNSNGSLYLFAEQQKLNAWEFDLTKRIVRCRKKGNFIQDLEKSKILIDLYIQEYKR